MGQRHHANTLLATALLGFALAASANAQEASGTKVIVGTKAAPPFAMKNAAGNWTGISIALWEEVAVQLGLQYEYQEYDLEGLLTALEEGAVDVGVAALTATGERELVMDFTHPFYTTGFGIAVAPLNKPTWTSSIQRFFSARFLQALGALALTLFAVGFLVWLVERRHNPDQFGGSPAEGIWSGFWWAAVTMTTVGYGDKAPKTFFGRLLTLVWMFTALVLIGTFIAAMTSALTVGQLESPIRGPEDLPSARVATVATSTSETYLRENRIPFSFYDDEVAALQAVANGEADAVVYDAPLLRYRANELGGKVEVLPRTFDRQDYCIAMPTGSPLREPINRVLLADATRAIWQDILFRYLERVPAPPARPQS